MTEPGEQHATFTDTVGVLTSWTGGVLEITRRDGESVRVGESSVVAGKVVPPAPARRRGIPAADARELTEVAARGWPALETEPLGAWTLRASLPEPPSEEAARRLPHDGRGDGGGKERTGGGGAPRTPREGFTTRANSVLPLGSPGLPLDEAVDRVERWYDARGLVPRIQVTTGGADTDELLTAELARRGWSPERHALMRVGALAPVADRAPDPRVRLSRTPDENWLSLYGRITEDVRETALKVLTGGPSVWFATVDAASGTETGTPCTEAGTGARTGDGGAASRGGDGRGSAEAERPGPAAIGRCVIDGRWAGFAAIEVAPSRRREGLARAVMAELARTALSEGASAAYLQVTTDNDAARALYDGMGFADHHAYHYRSAPRG